MRFYRALISKFTKIPLSLRATFERIHAGRAITFHNKRRYGCHNSETARSVNQLNDMTKLRTATPEMLKTGTEVLNKRNNDTRFMNLFDYYELAGRFSLDT